jgi:tetratricopeptide (TPR) repeat protein
MNLGVFMNLLRSKPARWVVPCFLLIALALASCTTTPQAKSARFIAAGQKFLKANDIPRAILQFESAVKATPGSAEAHYQLATAFLAAGDGVRTGVTLRKALALNPQHRAAQLLIAKVMASTSDKEYLQDAQKRLQALLQTSPNDADTLHALALTELKLGDQDDAVRDLGQAMAAAPQSLLIAVTLAQAKLQGQDPKGAEEVLKQAQQNSPKSAPALVVLGKFYSAENRPQEAEQQFQRALALDGGNTAALFSLGVLQSRTGKKQEAEQTFRKLSRMPDKQTRGSLAAFFNEEGRQDEAMQELARLYKEDPTDRTVRTWLINGYLSKGRTPEAEKLLAEALRKNPKDLDALLQRGEIALAARNFTQAETDLNHVVALQPVSPEVHYILAKLYLARKEDLRYREELTRALQLNPFLLTARLELSQDLISGKEAKSALDILDHAPSPQKQLMPILVARNWALWAMGDFAEMRKGIDAAMARGRSADLLMQDGLWKLNAGNPSGARASVQEALKINPGDIRALAVIRQSYAAQKQSAAALETIKEYANKEPKSAPVQELLGMVLMANGNRAQAREAFVRAKAADPQFTQADLSLVQVDAAEGRLNEAQAKLQQVVGADPGNTLAQMWLGNLEEDRGDHAAAMEQFRKVVAADPNNIEALNNLAYLLSEYGKKPDDALKYAEKALQLAPDNPEYADTIGWILFRKGLYSSAVTQLERTATHQGSPVWQYHLAMAYAKNGEMARGRAVFEAALKRNPNLPEAKMAQDIVLEHK